MHYTTIKQIPHSWTQHIQEKKQLQKFRSTWQETHLLNRRRLCILSWEARNLPPAVQHEGLQFLLQVLKFMPENRITLAVIIHRAASNSPTTLTFWKIATNQTRKLRKTWCYHMMQLPLVMKKETWWSYSIVTTSRWRKKPDGHNSMTMDGWQGEKKWDWHNRNIWNARIRRVLKYPSQLSFKKPGK